MSHPAAIQRAAHEQITAIRRDLGALLKAWRARSGLSQTALAGRIGYSRCHVSTAESGGCAARAVFEAADPVLGAGGDLLAARDQAAATITAIRQKAARQQRAAQAARLDPPARPSPSTAGTATCPYCQQVAAMTLTALPPSPPLPGGGQL